MSDFDADSAGAQLRVIRSLMERATIYRSLSAPTALVGGLLSFGGLGLAYAAERLRGVPLSDGEYLVIWLTILALTGATNGYFLWREARKKGGPFFSPGMKCALMSVVPPFLCAGFFSVTFVPFSQFQASAWILFYGLGLLAMQHFAPRSIVVLGWTFVMAFIFGSILCSFVWARVVLQNMDDALVASWLMALTFGLFHIVYAIAVWAQGEERAESPAATPTESGNV